MLGGTGIKSEGALWNKPFYVPKGAGAFAHLFKDNGDQVASSATGLEAITQPPPPPGSSHEEIVEAQDYETYVNTYNSLKAKADQIGDEPEPPGQKNFWDVLDPGAWGMYEAAHFRWEVEMKAFNREIQEY